MLLWYIVCFLQDFEDIKEVTQAGGTNVVKSPEKPEENTSNETKPKTSQKKKRKTNVEKPLEAIFDKFNQFSNDEFLRYITVTLIREQ